MRTPELASNPSTTLPSGMAAAGVGGCSGTPRSLGGGALLGPRQSRAASPDEFSAVSLSHLLGHTFSRVEYFQLLT